MERDQTVGHARYSWLLSAVLAAAVTMAWVSLFSSDDLFVTAPPYVVHDQSVSNFSASSDFLSLRGKCDEQLGHAFLQRLHRNRKTLCKGTRSMGNNSDTSIGKSEVVIFRDSSAPGCAEHASEAALIENARLPGQSAPGVSLIVDCPAVNGDSLADAFSSHSLRGNISVEQEQNLSSASAQDTCAHWILEDTMFIDTPRTDYFRNYYHTMEEIFAVAQTATLLGRQVADFRYVFGLRQRGVLSAMQLQGQLKDGPPGHRPYGHVHQLIDLWSALVWRPPSQRMNALHFEHFRNRSLCFRRLVFPMRACSGSILPATWSSWPSCSQGNPIALQVSELIKQSFWKQYGGEFNKTSADKSPNVAMIVRKRKRVLKNMDDVIVALRALPSKPSVAAVDMGALSIKEQVRLISSLSVLVGAHGAGLTHVLLLPRGAALVEITAYWWSRPRAPANIFMNLAAWTGHPYQWVLSWTWNVKEDLWWYTNPRAVARAVQAGL